MLKKILIPLALLIVLFCFSCRKDKLITDSSAQLEFSTDTIIFDTVFTQIGSITKVFKIYNPHLQTVNISSIELAGGEPSNFRINIDGVSAIKQTDIELKSKDSLYIFVEVTVDPTETSNPMIITDSIIFITNGNQQDVDLVAWGQDFYYWYSIGGKYFFPINQETEEFNTGYTLPNDKPHVVYGYLTVDSSNTLTIQAGTKMHFHQYSGLAVDVAASLFVEGTADNPVIFTSDRTDIDYRDIPGQWGHPIFGGIWFYTESLNSTIDHAIIRNGNIGIKTDSTANPNSNTVLTITNSVIENMSGVGLLAYNSTIKADNCIISNCGQHTLALPWGGDYEFNHCTFANYWTYESRNLGQLVVSNYFEAGSKKQHWSIDAEFNNCIVHGNKTEELVIEEVEFSGMTFNYQFNDCILRTELNTTTSNYNNALINPANITIDGVTRNPIFADVEIDDYHLFEQSVAVDYCPEILGLEIDKDGVARDSNPDAGAVEYTP
ncbi:MAG: hypothetical protein JKY53_08185 [Flavobacteriales bacterium]|nr:hypothetical protein [Flavobacteriales bacterium]